MSMHIELADWLDGAFGERLAGAPELRQDALILALDNGVRLEIRYAATDAYSFEWGWGEARLRIDTAPVHGALATAPNHFHAADGRILPDPVTRCTAEPRENLRALIVALLEDPLLGS